MENLAREIAEFAKEIDYYDYIDQYNSDYEAVKDAWESLTNPKYRKGLLADLKGTIEYSDNMDLVAKATVIYRKVVAL